MKTLNQLIELLTLKKIGDNTYIGQNENVAWGRIFGGQVLGQSLHATYQTVPKDKFAHSMHAYFTLAGKIDTPIIYEVDEIRNGRSFLTRNVVAKQNNIPIFYMTASFHKKEKSIEHHTAIPAIKLPHQLESVEVQLKELKNTNLELYNRFKMGIPEAFDFKPLENIIKKFTSNGIAENNYWFKTIDKLDPYDIQLSHQLLAYKSDFNLILTPTLPHRKTLMSKKIFYASLDHSIWFHRDFNIDDWLLYSMDSPNLSNARGFSRGSFFDTKGNLIASVAQESLIREFANN